MAFNTGSNIGRCDVVNVLLVGVNLNLSPLALKRIFWDVNGVAVENESQGVNIILDKYGNEC